MSPDAARAAVESAERGLAAAHQAEGAAVVALSDAGDVYGDSPNTVTERAWRDARDARDLAALATAGAVRKLDNARAALDGAIRSEARAELDAALPAADRRAMFARLSTAIATIAAVDAVPLVDVHQAGDDGALVASLDAEHERRIERARASRTVRVEVERQRRAAASAVAAAVVLGAKRPDVGPVDEGHVYAAAALEVHAMTAVEVSEAWWTAWLARFYRAGSPMQLIAHDLTNMREAARSDVGAWIDIGRDIARAGDTGEAARAKRTAAGARAAAAAERAQILREQEESAPRMGGEAISAPPLPRAPNDYRTDGVAAALAS